MLDYRMREFERKDNDILSSWFIDPYSKRWLESPWSDNDLDLMESEVNGRSYVLETYGVIIGQIGCYLACDEHSWHHLSEIHTCPLHRKTGIARFMIQWLSQQKHAGIEWRTSIDQNNIAAVNLFESLGWSFMKADNGLQTYKMFSSKTIQADAPGATYF